MKITSNTPDQLILSDVPWLFGIAISLFILVFCAIGLFTLSEGILAGLIFILVGGGLGLGAFAAFVRRMQVIFDRPSGLIVIRARSLFGYTEVRHDLADLAHAELEATGSDDGQVLHRPVLVLDKGMSRGRHPMIEAYVSGSGPGRMVDAVNGWLGLPVVDSGTRTP